MKSNSKEFISRFGKKRKKRKRFKRAGYIISKKKRNKKKSNFKELNLSYEEKEENEKIQNSCVYFFEGEKEKKEK